MCNFFLTLFLSISFFTHQLEYSSPHVTTLWTSSDCERTDPALSPSILQIGTTPHSTLGTDCERTGPALSPPILQIGTTPTLRLGLFPYRVKRNTHAHKSDICITLSLDANSSNTPSLLTDQSRSGLLRGDYCTRLSNTRV